MNTRFIGSLSLVAVAAACGGSTSATTATSSGAGGAPGPTAAEACAVVWKARCEQLDACTNNLGVKVRFGDEATCEARNTPVCENALAAPGTGSSPSGVEECASAITTETCVDYIDNNPPVACQAPPGALADGAACAYAAQCMSTFCKVDRGKVCGVCAALPAAGDACATVVDCGRGFICARDAGSLTGMCEIPVAKDGTCDAQHPCGSGLSCVGMAGTCQAAGSTVGATCDAQKKTGPACDPNIGLYCTAAKTCDKVSYVAAGQPCGVLLSGMTYTFAACDDGAACIGAKGTTAGTCVAAAADGAACDEAMGPPCLGPAKCVVTGSGTSGTCTPPDATKCM